MKVIAVTAAKGGVGKSTITVHIAALAAHEGLSVLIADLDPQRSAGDWRDVREGDSPLVAPVTPDKLDDLVAAAKAEGIDLLVIDTPPYAQASILPAAKLSDIAIIPTRPAPFDLRAIGRTIDMLSGAGVYYSVLLNCTPPRKNGVEASIVTEARDTLKGQDVCPISIVQRTALSHALISGSAVNEYEPNGKAAKEISALWGWIKSRLNIEGQANGKA